MPNEKKYNPLALLAVLGGYFVINSILIVSMQSSLTKTLIIGIDVVLILVIAFLSVKYLKTKKNIH